MSRSPLEQIREQHFELQKRMREIEALLGESPAGEDDPAARRSRLEEPFADLEGVLIEHFASEEQGGYFAEVLGVAPRLSGRVARLRRNHPAFRRRLTRLREHIRDPTIAWPEVEDRVAALLKALADHESAENDLVHEAFMQDLGSS
jgi:hypothetical protein